MGLIIKENNFCIIHIPHNILDLQKILLYLINKLLYIQLNNNKQQI